MDHEYVFVEKTIEDNIKVTKIINGWGSDILVSRMKIYNAGNLKGIIVYNGEEIVGICLYYIEDYECEIVLLEAMRKNVGIGTALIKKVMQIAKNSSCNRLWMTTSNDNIDAIKFYQRRGFSIANVHIKAMEEARKKIKPEIPLIGNYNIPIKDEFEFEMQL